MQNQAMSSHTIPGALELAGASVIITRPAATAAALVRAVRRRGASVVRLPGSRLCAIEDADATRAMLFAAQSADAWIFTSPAAVDFCLALTGPFTRAPARQVFAVGAGTGRALARRGIASIVPLGSQNSEGLLDEAALSTPKGWTIAIIDAPGGRDLLAPGLRERGATVSRIGVYRRMPPQLTRRQLDALDQAARPWLTLLSSGAALEHLMAALPPGPIARWQREALIVSSERLRDLASGHGFADVHLARSALDADLIETASSVLSRHRL